MGEVIFDANGLVVTKIGAKFYLTYDAGAHQVAIRRDEISQADAERAMKSPAEANKVLVELQQRLSQSGSNPYAPNVR